MEEMDSSQRAEKLFLTGYGRVKAKGMGKYASEVLSRQYPP